MKNLATGFAIFALVSCAAPNSEISEVAAEQNKASLGAIAAQMSAEHKARHAFRNPVDTLAFFEVKPGDTVVEVLPGGGWYSKILLPYLGLEGKLIGADYSHAMWQDFGRFTTPTFIEKRKKWPSRWVADSQDWKNDASAVTEAYTLTSFPESLNNQVDSVLFIRAMHHLARLEEKGQHMTAALSATYRILKPGGHVGIVQHAMSESKPDAWADGNKGYLKRSYLINTLEEAGFEFVGESEINLNPKDEVQEGESVWRLPPSLRTEDKARSEQIGESNRVTLLFKKK